MSEVTTRRLFPDLPVAPDVALLHDGAGPQAARSAALGWFDWALTAALGVVAAGLAWVRRPRVERSPAGPTAG